eukprot:2389177-Alexandrium_andersonii.AAC.1
MPSNQKDEHGQEVGVVDDTARRSGGRCAHGRLGEPVRPQPCRSAPGDASCRNRRAGTGSACQREPEAAPTASAASSQAASGAWQRVPAESAGVQPPSQGAGAQRRRGRAQRWRPRRQWRPRSPS